MISPKLRENVTYNSRDATFYYEVMFYINYHGMTFTLLAFSIALTGDITPKSSLDSPPGLDQVGTY